MTGCEELERTRAEVIKICCVGISRAIEMEVCVCEQIEAALRDWEGIVRAEERLFSKHEIYVIRRVAQGWTDSDIAEALEWSGERVQQCIDRALQKMKLSSRIEVAFYAATEEGKAALQAPAA